MCLISRLILIYLLYQIYIHASVCICKFSHIWKHVCSLHCCYHHHHTRCASSREIKKSTYCDTNNRHYYYNDCHYHKMNRKKIFSLEHSQQWKSRSSESQTHTNETCEIFLFPLFHPFFACQDGAVSHTIVDEDFFCNFFTLYFFV